MSQQNYKTHQNASYSPDNYKPLETDSTWRSWLERARHARNHYTKAKPGGYDRMVAYYIKEAEPHIRAGIQAEGIEKWELEDVLLVLGLNWEFGEDELCKLYRTLSE